MIARFIELAFLCYTIPLLYEDGLFSARRWVKHSYVDWGHPKEVNVEMIFLTV